jgi:hypothetical protein
MSSLPEDFDIRKLSDRNYDGRDFKVNKSLVEHPFNRRKCTDVLMGLFFFLFLSGLTALTVIGYQKGHPAQMMAPISASEAICGYTKGTEDLPYLYIYDVTTALTYPFDLFGQTTCIKECPSALNSTLVCADQPMCDDPSFARYTSFSLMHYCVPNQ